MRKVLLVGRELLERMIQLDSLGLDAQQEYSALRAILSQPAEAEGVDLQRLAAEFDAAPDDAEWEPPHPIFQMARDLDRATAALSAVTAERDRLRDQVKALQSDANSWQSGYDKGRHDGTKHRQSEVAQLRAEVEALRGMLGKSLSIVEAHAGASHMLEGFKPTRNKWDELVDEIRAAMAAKEE